MATHTNLTPEAISRYRTTMQQRGESAKKNLQERQLKAHQIAQQAAALLREEFAVSQVILFGSLAHEHWFSATSLTSETRNSLDPYRGFRHVVRNAYTYPLDPQQIEVLVKQLPTTLARTSQELKAFSNFLAGLPP